MRDCAVTMRHMIATWEPGGSLLLAQEDGEAQAPAVSEWLHGVPRLVDDATVSGVRIILLPLESLLLRSVALPLSHPRFVDAAVIGQELEEQAGIDSEAWWAAWQLSRDDDGGVAGVAVAMPMAMRETLADDPLWSQAAVVVCDGWVRLQAHRHAAVARSSGEISPDVVSVWLDADRDGLFLGCWRGACCLGLRRLNWQISPGRTCSPQELAERIVRSCRTMGWDGNTSACGYLDGVMCEALATQGMAWSGTVFEGALPERLQANIAAVADGTVDGLNFRHGRWAAVTPGFAGWRRWRRAALLGCLAVLLWYGQQQWAIAALNRQVSTVEGHIAEAFHRGLPDQAVMLDPLGQLQVAARGLADGDTGQSLLHQIGVLSRVRKDVTWTVREIRMQDGVMRMRGTVADLAALNRLHDRLQREIGGKVTIEDTDLGKGKVAFRMRWK